MRASIIKYPGILLIVISVGLMLLTVISVEYILRICSPYDLSAIGNRISDNAKEYGWGYSPYQAIRVRDADTGEIYVSSANNHGWRDVDRQYENRNNAYRILVLGDSVTFGAIVPADKIYTRILEDRLHRLGYNAEVINIAYGGWGTDQELDVLIKEGLKYKPKLVVVQFCRNDLTDNTYFHDVVMKKPKKKYKWVPRIHWKPFYYEIDENNVLSKKYNQHFFNDPRSIKKRTMNIVYRSEILKRLYALYVSHVTSKQPLTINERRISNLPNAIKRSISSKGQLEQLELAINLRQDSRLHKYLSARMKKTLSYQELTEVIDSCGYDDETKDIILRICEDQVLNELWEREYYYYPNDTDVESYEWKLYLALMDEIKINANRIGASLAVFNEAGDAKIIFDHSWYRMSEEDIYKDNYLSHIPVLRAAMKEKGIGFVENTQNYTTARNDSHPNAEGNEAMADDLFKYLMLHHGTELQGYRK